MKPHNKGRIGGPFVPVLKDTIKTPAWLAMSHGARSLYVALKSRYNSKSQNAVYLSTRSATEELGSFSHRDNVRRWFRELQYYGFIVMVTPAYHGVGKGLAPHWRLTEEGHAGQPPTRDFLRWDGAAFHEQKSPSHYVSKKQNRGPPVRSTLDHPSGPVVDHPSGPPHAVSGPPVQAIEQRRGGPPVQAITSLPLPALSKAEQGSEQDLLGIPEFLRRVEPAGNG